MATPPTVSFTPRRGHLLFPVGALAWMRALQLLVTAGALYCCFRGWGPPALWMLAVLVVPIWRMLVTSAPRRRIEDRWRAGRRAIAGYPIADSGVPWRASFTLVVFPAALLFLLNDTTLGSDDSRPA